MSAEPCGACPDVHLSLHCPKSALCLPQPDAPALVLAASNEVHMCSLAWADTTREKGGPRGEPAAAGHTVKEGGGDA